MGLELEDSQETGNSLVSEMETIKETEGMEGTEDLVEVDMDMEDIMEENLVDSVDIVEGMVNK